MKPMQVNVLGKQYSITYVDNPAEVDLHKRKSLWGQVDYWTRTIRVYDNGRTIEDLWETILHEIVHIVGDELHLNGIGGESDQVEETVDLLGLALTDVLFRNGWMKE